MYIIRDDVSVRLASSSSIFRLLREKFVQVDTAAVWAPLGQGVALPGQLELWEWSLHGLPGVLCTGVFSGQSFLKHKTRYLDSPEEFRDFAKKIAAEVILCDSSSNPILYLFSIGSNLLNFLHFLLALPLSGSQLSLLAPDAVESLGWVHLQRLNVYCEAYST